MSVPPNMAGYLSDVEEVRRVIQLYIDGSNGDVAKLKEAFHPEARMMGQIQPLGLKTYFPIQNFIDMVAGKPGMAGPNYKYYVRSIDVTHDAGVAVVAETDYLGCDFVDYFSVAKIDGKWKITNKTYTCTGLTPKPLKIGYWKIRGLIAPVRYILEHLGIPYVEEMYEQGDAPDFDRSCWFSVKEKLGLDFPNLPYLIDGDVQITESSAIFRYITNQYASSDFGGKTDDDKAHVDMMFGVVSDIKSAATGHCYGSGDKNAVIEISNRMEGVQKFLGDKKFIVGDYVTWVDFFIFEQIELFEYITEGAFTKKYPGLAAYHQRIASLPKFSQYYKSDKFMKKPFNNKIAKIN